MSKSRRAQKYIRLAKRADKLSAQFEADIARAKSRLDPEIHARVTLAMEKRARAILTPEVIEEMHLAHQSIVRAGAELRKYNDRIKEWLRAEWKGRNGNRPLPGGTRTKRLRKKRETALESY